ncbi:putative glycolipid-binding domain-containing protein [Pedobacter nyackensis]|uniref:putative glycolipid-binding domain-containing protein n=1 Tax=Pedobacter nyackensis TaxID=475255 RepID=UPI00292EB60B|nr:putative glycolipid-binding domain-containing protein [Pedobacter nyackensis]
MTNAFIRIWKGKQTLEVFSLEDHAFRKIGGGIISGTIDNVALLMKYQINMNENFQIESVKIELLGSPNRFLFLSSDSFGRWFNEYNKHLPELDGCLVIDISATPFTKTLAIKNLGNGKKGWDLLNVVYIKIPELKASRVAHEYAKISERHYHFYNLNSGFQSEMLIDENDLVISYMHLFELIYFADR